jgi:hypothetical protein
MSRVSWPGAVFLVALAGAGGSAAGCNFIVGVGDYAVGEADAASGDDGASSGGSGSSSGGPGDDSVAPPGDAAGKIGDPCAQTADCTRGTCNGQWCTQACTSNSACGDNSFGQPNYCVVSGGGQACAPGCAADPDCAPYGGTSCTRIPGGVALVCTRSSATDGSVGPGGIGDPCATDADCTVGTCLGGPYPAGQTGWCSRACGSAMDTSCGSNTVGRANLCILNGADAFICFPGCATNTDCTPFSGVTCQVTTAGAKTFICASTNGNAGDPCSTSANSQWSTCTSPATCSNDIWCSQSCTTDSSCGANTAGQAGFCVPSTAGGSICFPGCTAYDDCATYPGTFCQQIYGSTRGFVCAASGHKIGDPCATNADCKQGTCAGNWCSQSCTSTSDTTCGTNSEGQTNRCVRNKNSAYVCFPGCTATSDCTAFGGATCKSFSGVGGTVCSF